MLPEYIPSASAASGGKFGDVNRTRLPDSLGYSFSRGAPVHCHQGALALLWQFLVMMWRDDLSSAVWASGWRRSQDEVDDGLADGGQAWLRRWAVDSFFP